MNINDNKIQLHIIFHNEEKILPYILNYYSKYCDLMVGYDNFSTDNSANIFKSYKKYTQIEYKLIGNPDDFDDNININIKNNVWKEYKNTHKWAIVIDADELIIPPKYQKLNEYVQILDDIGVTIPKTIGFNIVSDNFIANYDDPIYDVFKYGYYDKMYNKRLLFNAQKFDEINYNLGAHNNNPIGTIHHGLEPMYLLHYKHLGKDYELNKLDYYESRNIINNGAKSWYKKNRREIKMNYKKDKLVDIKPIINGENNKLTYSNNMWGETKINNMNEKRKQLLMKIRNIK